MERNCTAGVQFIDYEMWVTQVRSPPPTASLYCIWDTWTRPLGSLCNRAECCFCSAVCPQSRFRVLYIHPTAYTEPSHLYMNFYDSTKVWKCGWEGWKKPSFSPSARMLSGLTMTCTAYSPAHKSLFKEHWHILAEALNPSICCSVTVVSVLLMFHPDPLLNRVGMVLLLYDLVSSPVRVPAACFTSVL